MLGVTRGRDWIEMTVTPGFTAEDITGFVREYLDVPRGSRDEWLREQPFTKQQMHRWRQAYFDGDLEQGQVSHQSSSGAQGIAKAEAAEKELLRAQEKAQEELAALRHAHQVKVAKLDARIKMLERGNATLENAIETLQNLDLHGRGAKRRGE